MLASEMHAVADKGNKLHYTGWRYLNRRGELLKMSALSSEAVHCLKPQLRSRGMIAGFYSASDSRSMSINA